MIFSVYLCLRHIYTLWSRHNVQHEVDVLRSTFAIFVLYVYKTPWTRLDIRQGVDVLHPATAMVAATAPNACHVILKIVPMRINVR